MLVKKNTAGMQRHYTKIKAYTSMAFQMKMPMPIVSHKGLQPLGPQLNFIRIKKIAVLLIGMLVLRTVILMIKNLSSIVWLIGAQKKTSLQLLVVRLNELAMKYSKLLLVYNTTIINTAFKILR